MMLQSENVQQNKLNTKFDGKFRNVKADSN